jgi:hypothetical protein
MKLFDLRFVLLCAIAVITGLLIGWIDTSPGWDDTGITVAMIFISAFFIGLFSKNGAWIFALIIGFLITYMNYFISRSFDSAASFIIAFAGVYGGVSLKYLITN